MDIIPIYLNDIPYTSEITLSNKVYTLAFNYNFSYDFFTASLSLNGKILVENEKIVLQQFLFREACEDKDHNVNPNFPNELIFCGTEDNTIDRVSITNFGDTVNLYSVDRSEVTANG